jgi:hypothetical protein
MEPRVERVATVTELAVALAKRIYALRIAALMPWRK